MNWPETWSKSTKGNAKVHSKFTVIVKQSGWLWSSAYTGMESWGIGGGGKGRCFTHTNHEASPRKVRRLRWMQAVRAMKEPF